MNPFGSHLPTLRYLIEHYNIKSVFEFGCGLYSTNLFVDCCTEVYSCEMQSNNWYEKIKKQFIHKHNLTINFYDEQDNPNVDAQFLAINYFKSLNKFFDLVFVDGHKDSRWLCINECQKYTNIIVTHDTEDNQNYHWDRINLEDCWQKHIITDDHPWTTYWIKQ